jgi:hypothetical protein
MLAVNLRARGAGRDVSSLARAGSSATRARRRRGGIADSIFRDADGWCGGSRWRSAPPLAGRYGVDRDSTRRQRAHGLFDSNLP